MIMSMALRQNSLGYDISLQNYFSEIKPNVELPAPSRSAFCQARSKLKWQAFEYLLHQANQDRCFKKEKRFQWRSGTVRAIDGTWLTLPYSKEIIEKFPANIVSGKHLVHYPTATLVTAVNVFSGQISEAKVGNYWSSESQTFLEMIERFEPGDVSLLDRIYYSREMIVKMDLHHQFFVVRLRKNIGLYQKLCASGAKSMRTELDGVKIRVIRSDLICADDGSPIIIATNILDAKDEKIVELYGKRWKVETFYLRLKSILKIERFHARTINGIYQEIFAHLLLLSLIALMAAEAEENSSLDSSTHPNFKAAVEVIRRNFRYFIDPPYSSKQRKRLAHQISKEILLCLCRQQRGRHYPRLSLQPQNPWTQNRGAKKETFKRLKDRLKKVLTKQH